MKRMSHIEVLFFTFLFAVGGAVVAFAEETPSDAIPVPAPRTGISGDEYRVLKERARETQEHIDQRRDQMETPPENVQGRVETRREEARDRFEEKRQELRQRRDEMRQHIEAKRDELRDRWEARKAKLSELRKQIIKNHIERIVKRMQAAVDRLMRLADKVDERIGIIASDGADVSNATSLMTDARSAIARAQTELDEATANLRTAPETNNPAEGIGNARARFENVKAALREAHAALVEVIKSLKGRSATAPNTQNADEEPAGNE